jgi:rSAM/selenodomain-associated transferase 1
MTAPRPTLVIFAKAPVPGRVKTRLARVLGDEAACAVYRELLAGVLGRLDRAPGWRTVMAVTPDAAADQPALWPTDTPRLGQGPGELGARMLRVLARAAPVAPVVVVGSDIPGLDASHVGAAFAALARHDLVLGPAADGGFWLIGARIPPPASLFDGVRWSSPDTLADTLANVVAGSGPGVALLPDRLEDVDDAESYRRFRDGAGDQR